MVDKQGEGARGQPATSAWSVPEGAERMSGANALSESQNIAIAPHLRSFFRTLLPLSRPLHSRVLAIAAHADELVQEVMLRYGRKLLALILKSCC